LDLDFEVTEFPTLLPTKKSILPFENLWKLGLDVYNTVDPYTPESWVVLPLEQLDPEEIEMRFRKMKGQANTAFNTFTALKLKGCIYMAENTRKTLEKFEPWLRIIRALRIDGIQQKHLDKINKVIQEKTELENCISMGK